MNKRIDIPFLETLCKKAHMAEEMAKKYLALPLVIIPDHTKPNMETWAEYKTKHFGQPMSLNTEAIMLHDCMVYDERSDVYAHVFVKDDNNFHVTFSIDNKGAYTSEKLWMTVWFMTLGGAEQQLEVYYISVLGYSDIQDQKLMDSYNQYSGPIFNMIKHGCFQLMGSLQLWSTFNDQRDHYLMSVQEIDNKTRARFRKGGKKAADVCVGPNYVYLDRMPSAPGESSGLGGTVEPHPRRGHHKTLRHERYKNNPKYLIEDAIYIKPLWVGDRTKIVNGSVYTVLDK